jgi:hypothetical protein
VSAAPLDRLGPWRIDDLAEVDDELHRYEVVDGSLVVSPPPTPRHQRIARRLFRQLLEQESSEWEAVYEEYVRLGTDGRQPDLALLRRDAPEPRTTYGRPPEVFGLVVEVVSPTSRRRDRLHKMTEYADAHARAVPTHRGGRRGVPRMSRAPTCATSASGASRLVGVPCHRQGTGEVHAGAESEGPAGNAVRRPGAGPSEPGADRPVEDVLESGTPLARESLELGREVVVEGHGGAHRDIMPPVRRAS